MNFLTPVTRISVGLVMLTCSILLTLDQFGFIPVPADTETDSRFRLCETLATQAATSLEQNNFGAARAALQSAVRRNERVLSTGLRARDGRLLIEIGPHSVLWRPDAGGNSSSHVKVPLFKKGRPWGSVEVRFEDISAQGMLLTLWDRPAVRLTLIVAAVGFVAYLLYMKRTLRHLDPSAVIPTRVQAALDVMAEGVMLVDEKEQIVLANAAFARHLGRSPTSLMGVDASTLGWKFPEGAGPPDQATPWLEAIRETRTSTAIPMRLETENGVQDFFVNGAPVLDGWDRSKGAIATFDDVTELLQNRRELEEALKVLEQSQEEIRLQNEQLRVQATRDPLTGVSNRRDYMGAFEAGFAAAKETEQDYSCIMADIDLFKNVNDTHGHPMGDEVIKRVAGALSSVVRSTDSVCRYGGEEFLIVLPNAPAESAVSVAERIRATIDTEGFAPIPVTASFGVASIVFGAANSDELINQADEALYSSKQGGRNRVTRWDQR
jgi:diguanylate cyclase (GGDEF)-like protein